MLEKPAIVHTINSMIPVFSNWKRLMRNGTFRMITMNIIAPPIIQGTALFGATRILKNPRFQERFERITAIFDTINVKNVYVLTLFSAYPILRLIK